ELHHSREIPSDAGDQSVWLLDVQPQVSAQPAGRCDAARSDQHAEPTVTEESLQPQLDLGAIAEHVPGGVVELLPHALADNLFRRILRAAGGQLPRVRVRWPRQVASSSEPDARLVRGGRP